MQIVKDKAVLLKLRDPEKVTDIIPKSKKLQNNHVIVNWGLDEAHVLKNLNIKVPSPIESHYEWAGQYKP
jgi:hypothetical protein